VIVGLEFNIEELLSVLMVVKVLLGKVYPFTTNLNDPFVGILFFMLMLTVAALSVFVCEGLNTIEQELSAAAVRPLTTFEYVDIANPLTMNS